MQDDFASAATPQNQIYKKVAWLRIRWIIGLLGVLLLIAGQVRLADRELSESTPLPLGIWLTEQIHLGDPAVDNVLNGLPLLLIGGVLLGIALRGIPLLPADGSAYDVEKPFRKGMILPTWPWLLAGAGTFALLLWRVNLDDFRPFQVPIWIITLLIFATISAIWDRKREVDLSPHLPRTDLLWMIGLCILGIVIGAFRLQGLPDQLMGDEGNFWTIARDIAQGIFNPSIFAPGVYTFPVFSSILQAWFLRIFGVDLWGWRFGSVLMGIITLPPLYLLARDAFDRKLAIASSFVLITSPYFLAFSRLGYNNIQALFFTTISLYWLNTGLIRKSSLYLYLAGCAAGFGFYTYFAARFAIVISLAFIALIWLGRKIKLRDALLAIGFLLLGFMITASPHLVYGYSQDPQGMGYKAWESVFINTFNGLQFYTPEELYSVAPPFVINDNELFYNPRIYLVLITRGLLRTLLAFQKPGLISEHFIAFPLTGTIGVIFYAIGLVLTFWTIRQPRSLLLVLWFLANVFGLSTLNTIPPRYTHMIEILPALALITGMGINAIASAIASMHFNLRKFKIIFLAALIAITGIGGLYDYFIRMPDQYHPQPDQIVSWAELDSRGENFVYLYDDPAEKDFYPYIAEQFLKTVPYATVAAEDVINGKTTFSNQPTVIFFSVALRSDVRTALYKQWGDRLMQRTFYSTDGTPILSAVMNTPFVFERDKGLPAILRDSYMRLSLALLIVVLLAGFAVVAYAPATWRLKLPTLLKRLVDWFNAPGQPAPEDESTEWTDEILKASARADPVNPEPPAWTMETSDQEKKPGIIERFHAQINSARTPEGLDFQVKLHIPRLSSFNLPLTWWRGGLGDHAISLPPLHLPNPVWLIGSVATAVIAQVLIHYGFNALGILAYAMSAAGLFYWAGKNPKWKNVFAQQVRMAPRAENYFLIVLILLALAAHFYDLNYRVYGLEADEAKWTAQSWYSTILRVNEGQFADMHYEHLPVDFWLRSIFLRLFGLNFISARIESATLSLIAIIFLYFLVRMLTNSPPTALLSTVLYGFSFIELNTAHQALHDTHPAAWMMCSLFFVVLGIKERKLWQFQAAGIVLALGMLTYETFYPTPMIGMLYLSGFAVYEIAKKRDSVRNWFMRVVAISWPIALVYFVFTQNYLFEQTYQFDELTGAASGGILQTTLFILQNIGFILTTTFSHVNWPDSLINWSGPLINPLLLPFVIIGLIYNLWNIRRPHYAFILLWYIGQITPAPVMLGSVWPRIMYTATAPLIIWGALGLWTSLAALRAVFEHWSLRLAVAVFGLLLAIIIANDYRIFSSALLDPVERQKRRELADLTDASAGVTPMILLPYMSNQDDLVELESHVIKFAVAGGGKYGLAAAEHYIRIKMDQLLPTFWKLKKLESLDLIFDKTAPDLPEERARVLAAVLHCYPQADLKASGRFFNVYHFTTQSLNSPECFSPPAPLLTNPPDAATLTSGAPVVFNWDAEGTHATGFTVTLERKSADVYWIEIENAFLGPGWSAAGIYVNGFNGDGFLLDEWQAGEAKSSFDVPRQDSYRVWIRSYKRRVNDQHNFIEIAGHKLEFAANESPLDQWVWQDLGTFNLPAGQLPLTLTRTYGKDDQYSVFIDTLVITSDLDFHPARDNEWVDILTTPEIRSTQSEYRLNDALPPGEYRWVVRIYDGDRIVDPTGARGINSQLATFSITP